MFKLLLTLFATTYIAHAKPFEAISHACATQQQCLEDVVKTNQTFIQYVLDRWVEVIGLHTGLRIEVTKQIADLQQKVIQGPKDCQHFGEHVPLVTATSEVIKACGLKGGAELPVAPIEVEEFFSGNSSGNASEEFCHVYVAYLNGYCGYLQRWINDVVKCDFEKKFVELYSKRWLDCTNKL